MTREDAIYWIKNLAVLSTEKDMPQIEEALNMAIEALADRKTEPSEHRDCINCEDASDCAKCRGIEDEPQTAECPFDDTIPCEWVCTEYGKCKYKPKTEPQTDYKMPYEDCEDCETHLKAQAQNRKTEPQYDIDKGTIKCDNCLENGSYKCSKCDGEMYFKRLEVEDEPQTEENWYDWRDEQDYRDRWNIDEPQTENE